MLTHSREVVLNALMTLLQTTVFSLPVRDQTTFVVTSRRLMHWSDVPKTSRPALFLTCHEEETTWRSEYVPVYQKLSTKVFIYLDTEEKSTTYTPDTDISVILDAIDVVLSPIVTPAQTLGGLVSHCRVDGPILRDPGDMDGDGMIIIPIAITLT